MLTISDKALNYTKTKNLSFVVNIITNVIECDWGGCSRTLVKSFSIKVLYESEVDKSCYNVYAYQGVKVFVLKELKIKSDMHVYQKLKLPFMTCTFRIKGVEV